jgi:hypothetical protein
MDGRFDIVTIASAVGVAGYVAITLGYVALYDFGLSREAVRSAAMIAAILIAALVAIEFFGKRFGKASDYEQPASRARIAVLVAVALPVFGSLYYALLAFLLFG